jgi:hypothetical protein
MPEIGGRQTISPRPAEHGSEQQAAEQLEVAWHAAECYPLGRDGSGVG